MKYLVLLAVIAVVYFLWRNARLTEKSGRDAGAQRPAAGPQEMVSCAVCGLHLPRPDALAGTGGRVYCSPEHRAAGERA